MCVSQCVVGSFRYELVDRQALYDDVRLDEFPAGGNRSGVARVLGLRVVARCWYGYRRRISELGH